MFLIGRSLFDRPFAVPVGLSERSSTRNAKDLLIPLWSAVFLCIAHIIAKEHFIRRTYRKVHVVFRELDCAWREGDQGNFHSMWPHAGTKRGDGILGVAMILPRATKWTAEVDELRSLSLAIRGKTSTCFPKFVCTSYSEISLQLRGIPQRIVTRRLILRTEKKLPLETENTRLCADSF